MILGDLIWRIVGDTTDFDEALKSSDKKTSQFAKGVKNVAGLIGGYFGIKGVQAIVKYGAEFQKAFAEDELATIRLSAALKTATQIAPSAEKRFTDLANTLQATSIFGDDATKTQIAYLASLGKTEEQINQVINAAADLAAATGISLETAVQQLNATLVGSAGYLGRQNAAVRALSEEELKAGRAIEVVAKQYKGYAQAVGQSAFGGNEQFKNSIGDLKEALGRLIQTSGWQQIQGFFTKIAAGAATSINISIDTREATRAVSAGTASVQEQITAYNELLRQAQEAVKYVDKYWAGIKGDRADAARASARADVAELETQLDALYSTLSIGEVLVMKAVEAEAAKEAERAKTREAEAEKEKLRQEQAAQWQSGAITRMQTLADLESRISGLTADTAESRDAEEQALIDEIFAADILLAKKAELILATREQYEVLRERDAMQAYAENFQFALGLVNTAFGQLGEALGAGELSWKSFAKAGLGAIASILQALGTSAAAQSLEQFALFLSSPITNGTNLAASLKYGAASAAAFTGAGIVNGYAGSFADGGVIGGNVYNDGLVARVSSGEEVVNQNDRTQLIDYLKNAQSNQPIIVPVSIDGREVARVVTRYQTKGKA